jgi:predicted secreted protein
MPAFDFKIISNKEGKAKLFFIDGKRVSKSKFVFLEIQVSMSSGRFDTFHTTRTRSGNWAHHKTGYLTS